MFTPLKAANPRSTALKISSLAIHLALLAWMVHSPPPVFISPSSITRGDGGSTVTRLYFGGRSGITQDKVGPLTLPQTARRQKIHRLEPIPARKQSGNDVTAALRGSQGPAGSIYGSISYGSVFGSEVRPALPIVSPDPVVGSQMLDGVSGDEIIEITIDEQGNIIATRVLQSLGPQIDQRVLAALEQWQFAPATRNGVPIPSKQDVHYHFPR